MGSFSWLKADNLTNVANITYGMPFNFLIPREFGGGFIKDKYQDYGQLGKKENGAPKYDMYELLAFFNKDIVIPFSNGKTVESKLKYNGAFHPMKEIDEYTNDNREIGIAIGIHDKQVDKLKYPLKLVSVSYKGTYEDLDRPSYKDPNQGFEKKYRKSSTIKA